MKAGIYYGPKKIRIEEIEVPPLLPTSVLIDTKSSGICGSDIHQYFGMWKQPEVKVATGHELSGIVVDAGSNVTDVEIGDRVCAECFSHCGTCIFCQTGFYNLCDNIHYISSAGPGGFAEYSGLSATSLFKLPDRLSFEEGALVEPLAVAYRSIMQSQLGHNDRVVVLGAGTIGLFSLAVAKSLGIHDVLISAKYEHQARMAEHFGADHIIHIAHQDLRQEAKTRLKDAGVDAVIDTIAVEQTFNDALAIVRKAGTICVVGGFTSPFNVFLGPIVSKELKLVGSSCYSYSGIMKDFNAAIELIATNRIDVTSIVTHRFTLDEISTAFHVAADKTSQSIKVLINQ